MERVKKSTLIISSILVFMMLLAGCASDKGNSDKENNVKGNNAETEPVKASQPPGEAVSTKLLDKPLNLKVMTVDSSPQIVTDAPVFDYIHTLTNVKLNLEPVPNANYDQKAQTLIATNNLPDVMRIPNGKPYFAEAAKNGLFLPISDYLDYAPNLKKLIEENKDISNGQVNGKLYGFPLLGKWKLQLAQAPMIRMDLIEKLDLKVPTTFEELYEVLKKFKEAYPDKIPFTNREGSPNLLSSLGFAMGSGYKIYYDPDVDGGRYVYGPAHEEFKAPLEFLHRLYSEKLLDPDYALNTGDAMKEKLSSGKALFYFDNNSFGEQFTMALKPTDPDAHFDLLLPMENQFGQKRNLMYKKDWLHHFVINAKVDRPEDVVKFLDWMYGEEGTLTTNYGIKGEHYNIVDGEPVIAEEIINKYADVKDPFRTMQNALGIGFQAFTLNVDERPMALLSSDELVEWSTKFKVENGYMFDVPPPPLNDEEINRVKTLLSKIDTLVNQEVDKFIIGTKPLSEFDSFAQKLKDSGALEIEDIYNEANKRFLASNP